MGCCVSKCGPERHPQEECYHVQDKLVISQPQKTPRVSLSNRISPSPLSPITSDSSSPSFGFTNSSSATTASFSSKDRSFSNEFLWSCVKENPHVIRINSLKERSQAVHAHVHKLDPSAGKANISSTELAPKESTPQRVSGSTSQKRVRSNSPTIQTRQKSFRREPERTLISSNPFSLSNRTLIRSPSPSRRFNVDSGRWGLANTPREICSKRFVGSKLSTAATSISSSLKRERLRLASPYLNSSQLRYSLRNNMSETRIHRITSKIDEIAVDKALAHPDSDPVAMEDIDNPLISLDCFIFL